MNLLIFKAIHKLSLLLKFYRCQEHYLSFISDNTETKYCGNKIADSNSYIYLSCSNSLNITYNPFKSDEIYRGFNLYFEGIDLINSYI